MFGISGGEFFVIFLVVLLVAGPKQTPDLLRVAGRLYRKGTRMVQRFYQTLDDTLYDSDRIADRVERALKDKKDD